MADGVIPLLSDDPLMLLDASGVVGDWVHDLSENRIALSKRFAALLGLHEDAAANGIPMAHFLDRMRQVDGARLAFSLERLRDTGGAFEARFEIPMGTGEPRIMKMCGRIERDEASGTVSGRGIVIDATQKHAAGPRQREGQVNLMAEHAIALRHLADGLQQPALIKLVESVMVQIGLELAQILGPAGAPQRGTPR